MARSTPRPTPGRGALAGELLPGRRRGRAGRSWTSARARSVEVWTGRPGGVADGARLEGAFGRKVNAPVRLDPADDRVHRCRSSTGAGRSGCFTSTCSSCSSFSVSHVFFNRGEIFTSVPLVYPVLRLPARAHAAWLALPRPRELRSRSLPHRVAWLAMALIFLVGFRIGLNLTNSNVIDVGYSGVIGADRIADGEEPLRRASPTTMEPATRTGRSTTTPTCPSSRSFRGPGAGTTCRLRTRPRSSSTC